MSKTKGEKKGRRDGGRGKKREKGVNTGRQEKEKVGDERGRGQRGERGKRLRGGKDEVRSPQAIWFFLN